MLAGGASALADAACAYRGSVAQSSLASNDHACIFLSTSPADFTLMYQHCVGVLLKRDTDLGTKEVSGVSVLA